MPWTNDDLIAIDRAVVSGATTVHYRDRSVTYRSLDELLRIRALIAGEVNPPAGCSGNGSSAYPVFHNGLTSRGRGGCGCN